MRVLQLTQRFPPALGGVENHVQHLAEGLQSNGVDVDVFTTDLRTDIPFERLDGDTPTFPFPVRRFRAVRAAVLPHALGTIAPGLLPPLLAGHWNVVHAHAYGYFPTFAAATRTILDGSALVITPHSDPGRRTLGKRAFDRVVPSLTLRKAHRIIALTNREARYLQGIGVDARRIVVIPNGVNVSEFEAPPGESPLHPDGTTILFAGRCYLEQKGLHVLVRAASLLPAGLDLHYRIVGEDWGGHSVIRALAAKLGIEDRITIVGRVDRKRLVEEFRRADIFVLPSLFDSFPIAILEAMAAGLPVVATRVGGVPDIVREGITGLLVEPGDPQALAAMMERLALDATVRREMGRRGRERAHLFSWEDVVSKTKQAYVDAVAESGR